MFVVQNEVINLHTVHAFFFGALVSQFLHLHFLPVIELCLSVILLKIQCNLDITRICKVKRNPVLIDTFNIWKWWNYWYIILKSVSQLLITCITVQHQYLKSMAVFILLWSDCIESMKIMKNNSKFSMPLALSEPRS